ncbi:hypothetical protein YA0850_27215 [Pseudomonas veronii]|uniref:Uncharacterized protein n=1 Tax=Pseudomonas veronii TaxID=76761 RepID=A0ABS0VSJ2_PSEVE|nr:hypothetical protein [Pseudomonas veronii]MBI6653338.1 hypothetical protein [Pseudomonas veronii]NWD59301.1 hypothetical protein [Pseudomonas veronii]
MQISFGDCLAHVFYTITTLISIDIIGLPSEINNSRLFLLASRISKVLAWRMAAPAVFDHDSRSAIQHPGKPAWQSPDRLRKITIDHLG